MNTIKTFLTESTCGEACWHAREEICRCSCSGRNHGVLLVDGAEKPARTCKVGKFRFKLIAVELNSKNANNVIKHLYEEIGENFYHNTAMRPSFGEPGRFVMKGATASQTDKWPELSSFIGWNVLRAGECMAYVHDRQPYLIWERI